MTFGENHDILQLLGKLEVYKEGSNMSKMKLMSIGIVLLLIISFFAGCLSNKYNAELFDTAAEWINEDFANNNIVRRYGNPEDEYPKTLTFIVDTQEEYHQTFHESANELSVDFNTQMLVVYTFSAINHRNNTIKNLNLEEDVLTITYEMEKKYFIGDTCQPYQRWFVVKIDKLPISSVVFEESN